ncbi:MAG: dihydrodipicolinate synthase family protein [Planctomycetota bacterium]|nr:dihydrodipicolinate synthase family protein [Planctomycetota bacterium]MDA1143054.1 dihydrodipicolinate synthase family protein [Planctomycetota bacterium]
MFPEDLIAGLKNVHAYAVTPFKTGNLLSLDLDGLAGNLEFLIKSGVKVINIGGGTGEINALTDDELLSLAETALQVAGDRALIVPSLRGNLKSACDLAPKMEKLGARIVLAMPPYIRHAVPENPDGIVEYFRIVAESSDLPLLPYNTQAWPAEFFERLAEIKQIIGIKDPCQSPHGLFIAIRRLGSRFVWIGNKRHQAGVLQLRFQAGIEGFTAGLINFVPEFELELFRAVTSGDIGKTIKLQEQLAPLEHLRDVHGDAALPKAGLDLRGLTGGSVRAPRVNVSKEGRQALSAELKKLRLDD